MEEKRTTLFQINLSSLSTMLLVLFIGLRLGNVITWSWWWVLSPLWMPFVLIGFAWLIVWFFGWLLFRNTRKNLKLPW
jgi:hypothetical protein